MKAGFALGVRYIYVPPRTRLTDHVRGWLNESQLAPAADRDRAWRAVMARDVRLLERSALLFLFAPNGSTYPIFCPIFDGTVGEESY